MMSRAHKFWRIHAREMLGDSNEVYENTDTLKILQRSDNVK